GPTRVEIESSRPRTTLADASSEGVWHSSGSRAEFTGRYRMAAAVEAIARAYTATGEPSLATRTAIPAAVAHRVAETRVRTRSRRQRSASADANGASTAEGSIRSSDTRPTAFAPPCEKA